MIEIDGKESGGQVLRTALSLSALTGKPFKMVNIRGLRTQPGLKQQHLTAINSVKELCNAKVIGTSLGSRTLEFLPSKVKGGNFNIDIGTAGSTTLVLQTLIPPCLHEEKETKIAITGGTDTIKCPGSHYFKYIFLDFLKRMNIKFKFEIERYGFYPKGNGLLNFTIEPCKDLKELNILDQGKLKEIAVDAICSKELEKADVAKRLITGFRKNFTIGEKIKQEELYVNTLSTGCFIFAKAEFEKCSLGSSALGELHVKAEDIGKTCASDLQFEMDGKGIDHNAADQLMIYMALKGSGIIKTSRIGQHVKTNAPVIEQFLPVKFELDEKENIIKVKKNY